jgi:hypothetical protein
MRALVVSSVMLCWSTAGVSLAAEPPVIQPYLNAGELVQGEQELERAVLDSPRDDLARFSLGVIKLVRAVERMGQSFYEYGLKSEHASVPFLRLPVPHNPDPGVMRYGVLCRILDSFRRDLLEIEQVLAEIRDPDVVLPLELAEIKLDLDGNSTDRFLDILKKIMRSDLSLLKDNPRFLVAFDRGDVAWLRAYCHLLAGIIDIALAIDLEPGFEVWGESMFPRVALRDRGKDLDGSVRFVEPRRLSRFRHHLLAVCELNHETWDSIRAEKDDHYEWLPNPNQKGVLGVPVSDRMIDTWLEAVAEIELLLEGKTCLPTWGAKGRRINLKMLLESPPKQIDLMELISGNVEEKYLGRARLINLAALGAVWGLFEDPTRVGMFVVWFN